MPQSEQAIIDREEAFLNTNLKKDEDVLTSMKIHQMPKGYKTGNFDYNNYNDNVLGKPPVLKTAEPLKSSHKKTGMLLVGGGVVLLLIIGALVYLYFKNPNFLSFLKVTQNAYNSLPAVPTTQGNNSSVVSTSTFNTDFPADEKIIVTGTSQFTFVSSSTSSLAIITTSTPQSVLDTDKDGLSNKEEAALGTSITKTDTDGDGYSDYTEVDGLYNPTGAGKIDNDRSLTRYVNDAYKYSLLYPSLFSLRELDGTASVIITAPDNSFFQAVAQVNAGQQTISNWYKQQFNQTPTDDQLLAFSDFSGVLSQGGTLYFTDIAKTYIYVVSYSPADVNVSDYQSIAKLIALSFQKTR